ncbi:beta-ketoacyl synthase N-terminal-like domain-containing protein [Neisseria shayeganii]|uniref:Beta-ketoacyl synthase n=1 Tax=Neisseria shayeganii 871 TaxID=1032488 RepID=G4CHG1_9NEIS|nr:beta-ketoacyl synthase N-terminal-like domain-containing protein [Neisseria shayeganii]EGY52745.1 beta-ketoacyl synthase [Neisseria shayeganii 871]
MPLPVYLCGGSYDCAQGRSGEPNLFSHPDAAFRPPQPQTVSALGSRQALPYFKAFSPDLLTLPDLCRLAEAQILAAAEDAGWLPEELAHIPLFIGSTSYVMSDREARQTVHGPHTRYAFDQIAGYLKQRFGHPNVFSFATSCTSSAQALVAAAQTVANGLAPRALVLGFESFNRMTFEHFHAMHLLAEHSGRLPFQQADGMILGEAAACVALRAQAARTYQARLLGPIGQTDCHNLTASSEAPLRRLLADCLQAAGLSPSDLCAVKTHGSGGSSDDIEAAVLADLLPEVPAILLKPYTGHTLGATAALESALLLHALRRGALPALPGKHATHPNLPTLHGQTLDNGAYLHYFLGFGGSHSAWVLDWQT